MEIITKNYLIFIGIYLILSIFVFVIYGIDKYKAKKSEYRISEKALFLLAFLGPLGALLGMKFFRHKTKKYKFKLFIPFFFIIHLLVILFIVFSELWA